MKIIRFIDIVDSKIDEDGRPYEELIQSNFTLPMLIDNDRVDAIYPLFATSGKLFKNVSIIKYDNELLKVVGNYKELYHLKINGNLKPVGFRNGQQKEKTIENRTKTKSTIKPRAKGSST